MDPNYNSICSLESVITSHHPTLKKTIQQIPIKVYQTLLSLNQKSSRKVGLRDVLKFATRLANHEKVSNEKRVVYSIQDALDIFAEHFDRPKEKDWVEFFFDWKKIRKKFSKFENKKTFQPKKRRQLWNESAMCILQIIKSLAQLQMIIDFQPSPVRSFWIIISRKLYMITINLPLGVLRYLRRVVWMIVNYRFGWKLVAAWLSPFLELILMEHIDIKHSLESKLQIGFICFIRIRSINRDISENSRKNLFSEQIWCQRQYTLD